MMITLYTFGAHFGLSDPSPFVTKAEMLLKFAGLPYRTDNTGFRRAPKGKLPYIDDEGEIIADSTFIRWHLEKKYQFDFDQGLSPEQRGIAWAVEKMLEDNVYWALVDARWIDDANFAKGPAQFFDAAPWPIRPLIKTLIRRKVRQALLAQGMGRHRPDELQALACRGIEALSQVLGDKPYLLGERPCAADACAYAFVVGLLCPHFTTTLRQATENQGNLVAYAQRLGAKYFP